MTSATVPMATRSPYSRRTRSLPPSSAHKSLYATPTPASPLFGYCEPGRFGSTTATAFGIACPLHSWWSVMTMSMPRCRA